MVSNWTPNRIRNRTNTSSYSLGIAWSVSINSLVSSEGHNTTFNLLRLLDTIRPRQPRCKATVYDSQLYYTINYNETLLPPKSSLNAMNFYSIAAAIFIDTWIEHCCKEKSGVRSCEMLSYMNPATSADEALDSFLDVDIDWMEPLHANQTKPPEQDRSRSLMELTNIINTANQRSRMIAAPPIGTGAMSSWNFTAGITGSWKLGRDMYCRNSASVRNSLESAPIPTTTVIQRSSCGFILKNVPSPLNTSGLHNHSSSFQRGAAAASEAAANLYRGAGSVKVKKKRVRPSRRVPTTVVKTDTTNFKAMVHYFTGIPHTSSSTGESTLPPSATSYSPESTMWAISPSFSNTLHPILSKIPKSSPASLNPTPSAATTALLSSSFPARQSLFGPPFIRASASITGSCYILNSTNSEELTRSLNDSSFFDNCPAKY